MTLPRVEHTQFLEAVARICRQNNLQVDLPAGCSVAPEQPAGRAVLHREACPDVRDDARQTRVRRRVQLPENIRI